MKRVVFVDDEPNVLSGLKRMLRTMRSEWETEFYDNGADALSALETTPCDVIVSDMRMPAMDGVELLSNVRKMYPETIRIALSGQSDANMIYRCIKNAHQYLAKPCDAEQLTATVNRACDLQRLLSDDRLKTLVSTMSSLPSLPAAYEQIMEELQSEDASLQKVGKIVETDVAMTVKILQLVNSAYFGLPRHVSSPAEAAMFLGVDTIKTLVLTNGIFTQFNQSDVKSMGLENVWKQSEKIGTLARKIALDVTGDKLIADYSMMAGLLSDIGTLVLASGVPAEFTEARQICEKEKRLDWEIENELLGYSHMEVGAYLVGLWGLPNPMVEAIAYHHYPNHCATLEFEPLTAVHIATAIARTPASEEPRGLDADYVKNLGLMDRIAVWHAEYANCTSSAAA